MRKQLRRAAALALTSMLLAAAVSPAYAEDDIATYEEDYDEGSIEYADDEYEYTDEEETWYDEEGGETEAYYEEDYDDAGDGEVYYEEDDDEEYDDGFSVTDNTSGQENQLASEPAPEEQIPDGMVKSYLTGEYVTPEQGRRRPISFMIDNVKDSWPQSGIASADIYYECEVEADLSRICAVFERYDGLQKIGPMRSCRDYFISLVSGLDAIYEHYGQAAYALPYLESDDVDNISGMMGYASAGFYRDGPFSAPHNCYTSAEGMQKMIDICGYSQEYDDDYEPMLNFAAYGSSVSMDGGREASYVKIGYPNNDPRFIYHPDTGLYTRRQYGGEHTDLETGETLAVKNIILEFQNGTNYQDSPYLHYETTGSGKGKYITDGKAVDITWSRESFFAPVEYKLADGSPLVLNTGKTWVNIIRNGQMDRCLIGPSEEELSCVVSDEEASAAIAENEKWTADYKAGELPYLQQMAQIRTDNVAKHNGETKVEVGLP